MRTALIVREGVCHIINCCLHLSCLVACFCRHGLCLLCCVVGVCCVCGYMAHFLCCLLRFSRDSINLLRRRCCCCRNVSNLLCGCVSLLLNCYCLILNCLDLDRSLVSVLHRFACGRCEGGQTLLRGFLCAFLGRCSALGQRAFDCAKAVSRGLWVNKVDRATNTEHHAVNAVWLACNLDALQVINLLNGRICVV